MSAKENKNIENFFEAIATQSYGIKYEKDTVKHKLFVDQDQLRSESANGSFVLGS